MIKAVLFVLSKIDLILISQILAKCNGRFLQRWFCSLRSSCITEAMHWSHPLHRAETELVTQYLQYLQSYLELFICHLTAAVPLLKIDNISPVCRYVIETWAVLMACTWKNSILLAAFWDKISIFHLGQMEHCLVRGYGPLCAQHRSLLASFDVALPSEREKLSWIDWMI